MSTKDLLKDYLLALAKQWYVVVAVIVDLIAFAVLGADVPSWIFLVVFGLVFVIANFLLYRETREESGLLEARYKREINGLQKRISELENRQPQLELFFESSEGLTNHRVLVVSPPPDEPNYDELVRQESRKLDSLAEKEERQDVPPALRNIIEATRNIQSLGRRPKEPDEYRKECDDYLQRYREYLARVHDHEIHLARDRSLHFAVNNSGKVPADEITVVLHFPDAFRFFIGQDGLLELFMRKEPPDRPKRPARFKPSLYESLRNQEPYEHNLLSLYEPPNADLGPMNVSGPFIEADSSTRVSYEIDHLLHNFTEDDLEPVEFYVTDDAVGHVWSLKYAIHAANLPDPIEGSLILEVTLDS